MPPEPRLMYPFCARKRLARRPIEQLPQTCSRGRIRAISPILLGLGYLDDVADDPFLPIERDTIKRYWQKRQPKIITAIERHGITAP